MSFNQQKLSMKSVLLALTVLGGVFPSVPLSADEVTYRVRRGDQLMTISNAFYGTHQKWKKIVEANPGVEPRSLEVGQLLRIPTIRSISESRSESFPGDTDQVSTIDNSKKVIEQLQLQLSKERSAREELERSIKHTVETTEDLQGNWRQQYEMAQIRLREAEEKVQALVSDNLVLKHKLDQLKDWEEERSLLVEKLRESEISNQKLTSENEISCQNKDLFIRHTIAQDSEVLLKEKARILSERLWIEKNGDPGQCSFDLVALKDGAPDFSEIKSLLEGTLGERSFFVEPPENKLHLRLPGETVFGVDNPKIRDQYKKILADLGEKLNKYGIRDIEIFTNSPYEKGVNRESGGRLGNDEFAYAQSSKLKKFFTTYLLVPENKVLIGQRTMETKSKHFELAFSFDKPFEELPNRVPAEIQATPDALQSIARNVYGALGNPKYGRLVLNRDSLEIHLGRHYFFEPGGDLKTSGQEKLKTLLKLFGTNGDLRMEVTWAPGVKEHEKEQDLSKLAFTQVSKLQTYMKKVGWDEQAHHFKISSKYPPLILPLNGREDRMNQRLVFRIVPSSLNVRYLDGPGEQ